MAWFYLIKININTYLLIVQAPNDNENNIDMKFIIRTVG